MPQAPAASALALRDPLGVITQVRFATTYGQSSCAFSVGCVIISLQSRRALLQRQPVNFEFEALRKCRGWPTCGAPPPATPAPAFNSSTAVASHIMSVFRRLDWGSVRCHQHRQRRRASPSGWSQHRFRVGWHALSLRRACGSLTGPTPFASCSGRATRKQSPDATLAAVGRAWRERLCPQGVNPGEKLGALSAHNA
jgi:hypothetical protein